MDLAAPAPYGLRHRTPRSTLPLEQGLIAALLLAALPASYAVILETRGTLPLSMPLALASSLAFGVLASVLLQGIAGRADARHWATAREEAAAVAGSYLAGTLPVGDAALWAWKHRRHDLRWYAFWDLLAEDGDARSGFDGKRVAATDGAYDLLFAVAAAYDGLARDYGTGCFPDQPVLGGDGFLEHHYFG